MKILVTGNLGYVGSVLVPYLRQVYPEARIIGFDTAFFASCYSSSAPAPERCLNRQIYGDIRDFDFTLLGDIDAIIHLAAISNDPMGSRFAEVTREVNLKSTERLAKWAKQNNVRNFVFASSCSVYGVSESSACNEQSSLDPLTEYAISKVEAEKILSGLASDQFRVKCLRFATACGASPRLRLDLVLNDFVAAAQKTSKILLLSDGTSWRPLIHVEDMARALTWAISQDSQNTPHFFMSNVGMNSWNFLVKDLAEAVRKELPNVSVEMKPNAARDKRSYRVDFSLFEKSVSDKFAPRAKLSDVVQGLHQMIEKMNVPEDFRSSQFVRLNVLKLLQEGNVVDQSLHWL